MSSSATSTPTTGKSAIPSNNSNYFQGSVASGLDIAQKRSNSSGSFGAGSATRHTPQARNNQSTKKQNKVQRRAKLVDEDALAETAAMRSINSRKGQTSITHLMNFSLPPRPQQHQSYLNHRHQRRNPTWGLGSGYHAMNKARYVHANYRFIVKPDQDCRVQTIDADIHISWDAVLQILASSDTQSTQCPICLSVPVAPRMAKCGHISCLPCLIRYMHSTDDANPIPEKRARWKKCPICEDSIYISEVRPVRWFEGQEASMLREGGDVLLRLLMREPGSTLALPRDTVGTSGQSEDIPWFHVAEVMDYARFMKGGAEYMEDQYDQEMVALEAQEKEDELMFGDENTWTRKAIASIVEAKQKVHDIGNPPPAKAQPPRKQPTNSANYTEIGPAVDISDASLGHANGMQRLSMEVSSNPTQRARAPFYFYHALPNFFLSPLDIRILKVAFGDFAAFPSTILPRVEHISTGHIVDDDLRKRAKYMAHMPYGCEVSFLECDWTDLISPTILDQFTEEIGRRRRRNHEKETREERDRVRAEKEEDDKRWAAARKSRPSLISKSFSETDFQPLVNPNGSPPNETALAGTPPWSSHRAYSSFTTLASPGTSPDGPRTVWGTAAINLDTPPLQAPQQHQPTDDGWLQGWEKDLLDEADAVALVEASINGEGSSKLQSSTISAGGKKGKKKKITLMSTNARRGA